MENQNSVKTGFNYVYFTTQYGVDLIWNDFDNRFELDYRVDFSDTHKFECNSIPEIARDIFGSEKCVCDGNGLQVGFYEFPENE